MGRKPTDFGYALTNFLTSYLRGVRNLSPNTIRSYRDTFKLLLIYAEEKKNISSDRFELKHLTRDLVNDYMDWLKSDRNLCQRSCNQRLAAIHSFCRYLHTENPQYILEYQRILAIRFMKCHKPVIEYLTQDALKAILNVMDTSTSQGRRDQAMLATLYDTGARVQELCGIKLQDVHFDGNPYILLTGKGNKSRYVPIMKNTAKMLQTYCKEFQKNPPMLGNTPLFYTRLHTQFTRSAVSHLITKYADMARETVSDMPKKVTPHTFRHTKAMHLCQAGIDLVYIRDILGHTKTSTTEIYAKINVEQMRDALEAAYPELNPKETNDWNDDSSLMDMLNSL